MCGIFGLYNLNKDIQIDKNQFEKSAKLMRHRGPDAYGQWGITNKIEFGHLRLSIIDLSQESNQPMFSVCKNYVIVFNGEIYNYIELKKELKLLGYNFKTQSDTEVLLNAYLEWDTSCVTKFNGDWAFSIYNIRDNIMFCSRDRFGVKPFNYSIVNDQFIFSSEIKSIINYFPSLKIPNYNVIANYCRNSLGAQIKETWFKDILRLPPAHSMVIDKGVIKIFRYWDYPKQTLKNIKFDDAVENYRNIFSNAVKLRMRSDVAVGTTLSSGIDSGSIASTLRRFYNKEHNTFTATFNNKDFSKQEKSAYADNITIDEKSLVMKLSSDLNLKSHFISSLNSSFINDLTDVIYYLESGHSSPAIIPLSKIMQYAKKHVSVMLEGQGADELLGGYIVNNLPTLFYEYSLRGNFNAIKNEYLEFKKYYSVFFSFKQFIRSRNINGIERFYSWHTGRDDIFGPKLKNYDRIKDYPFESEGFDSFFNSELYKSHTGGLSNLLHYGDAITMSNSIESRLPFMDVNLVEYAFKLPFDFKMKKGLGKYVHRIAMDNIVPDYILKNPIKFGFNTPLSNQFENIDSDANRILLSDTCMNRGLFNSEGLKKILNEQIACKKNHSTLLFRLVSTELWFRKFIDKT